MKAAAWLSMVFFAAACTAAQDTGGHLQMSTIARGAYAADDSGRKAILARSEKHYRELWTKHIGGGEAPAVDLEGKVAVFLLAGSRPTGGWTVRPDRVHVEGDTVVIEAPVIGPPKGAIVTQALTSPYAILAIHDRNIKKVRWLE